MILIFKDSKSCLFQIKIRTTLSINCVLLFNRVVRPNPKKALDFECNTEKAWKKKLKISYVEVRNLML